MKMNFVNKLFEILNEINSKEGYLTTVRSTNLSNELLETLKILENCISCKDKLNGFRRLIIKTEYYLAELGEKKEEREKNNIIRILNSRLIEIDDRLNRKVLCESCKEKKIGKLTGECENEEMARFLHESKLRW